MDRPGTVFSVVAVVATGLVAYAFYFDYKRRNDVEFRKKLRKEKKRVDKAVAEEIKEGALAASAAGQEITQETLREALEHIKNEEAPVTVEQKESYFMAQVGIGEQLSAQGPAFILPAAMAFYRALRVYPSPVELIVIYQKTVPEPVFKLVMDMTNLDVSDPSPPDGRSASVSEDEENSPTRGPPSETSSQEWDKVQARVEGYYEHFPPPSSNTSIQSQAATDTQLGRKYLVVNKDFKAGEVIYKECPIVATLDMDLQLAGTHCTHCLRVIEANMAITDDASVLPSKYCSKVCLLSSKTRSSSLLFTVEPPLPPEIPTPPMPPVALESRRTAQAKFVNYLKKDSRAGPLLVARFIARQVAVETNKMASAAGKKPATESDDFTDTETGEYVLADHIERWRYLEMKAPEEEHSLLVEILQLALPGLEQFITDERHATLLGKMVYNSYGVCFNGGREDKPIPTTRPEDVEKSRTPYGTQRQVGSAIYTLSSYLTHSCDPSARPSFSSGTSQLHLVANRDLKKGDELSVAFVDVKQHAGESITECRRRRRTELARGWRFACPCLRCAEEAKELSVEEKKGEAEQKDESKVEAPMSRYEGEAALPEVE